MFKQPKQNNCNLLFILNWLAKVEKKSIFVLINNPQHLRMKEKVYKISTKRVLGLTTTQIIVVFVLLVILFFFSDSSIPKRLKQESQIKDIQSQIELYRQQIEVDKEKLNELQSNRDDLEKFARENYFMKKENEEIFIIAK